MCNSNVNDGDDDDDNFSASSLIGFRSSSFRSVAEGMAMVL